MNLTLAADENTVEKARAVARSMGKSLNQLIREYLEELAGVDSRLALVDELESLGDGDSRGWKFRRDELYDRA